MNNNRYLRNPNIANNLTIEPVGFDECFLCGRIHQSSNLPQCISIALSRSPLAPEPNPSRPGRRPRPEAVRRLLQQAVAARAENDRFAA
jgi:hypothetical protein